MTREMTRRSVHIMVTSLLLIMLMGLVLFLFIRNDENQITGQAIRDIVKNQSTINESTNTTQSGMQSNDTGPAAIEDPLIEEQAPPNGDQSGEAREQGQQRLSSGRGGGEGGGAGVNAIELPAAPQFPSAIFEIIRPSNEFEIYDSDGSPIATAKRFEPGKKERFSLYKDGYPLSDFDLEFTDDMNLSDIRGAMNVTRGKSFIHSSKSFMGNRTLYVPRLAGQTNVRVCENAQNIDEIFEGCSQLPHITKEYVLSLGDDNLRATPDGLFFIVLGISGTGGQSEGNTRLIIYDDSDFTSRYPGELIRFYANYSDTSSNAPISGSSAVCNISFSDTGKFNMTFNANAGLYNFNRTFASAGVHFYNVSCNASPMGYLGLHVQDYASIQPSLGSIGGPDNMTRGQSQRKPTNPGYAQQAQGRNITGISIGGDFRTRSWQGFFGNISNSIILSDGNNNSFYAWHQVQPTGEVFASRALDVNFAQIDCSSQEQIYEEEWVLGQNNFSPDRVNITFNRSAHPAFLVSTTSFSQDQCRSTNINVNDAYQQQQFYEVLLSDGAQNLIYTAIVDANKIGFDGTAYDFQIIVGENEHNQSGPTAYYFFVELT